MILFSNIFNRSHNPKTGNTNERNGVSAVPTPPPAQTHPEVVTIIVLFYFI